MGDGVDHHPGTLTPLVSRPCRLVEVPRRFACRGDDHTARGRAGHGCAPPRRPVLWRPASGMIEPAPPSREGEPGTRTLRRLRPAPRRHRYRGHSPTAPCQALDDERSETVMRSTRQHGHRSPQSRGRWRRAPATPPKCGTARARRSDHDVYHADAKTGAADERHAARVGAGPSSTPAGAERPPGGARASTSGGILRGRQHRSTQVRALSAARRKIGRGDGRPGRLCLTSASSSCDARGARHVALTGSALLERADGRLGARAGGSRPGRVASGALRRQRPMSWNAERATRGGGPF